MWSCRSNTEAVLRQFAVVVEDPKLADGSEGGRERRFLGRSSKGEPFRIAEPNGSGWIDDTIVGSQHTVVEPPSGPGGKEDCAVQVDESRNGDEVQLPMGEVLELRLPERPTSGFRWSLASSGEPVCQLVGDTFEALEGPPGTGGTRQLRFRAAQPGLEVIELVYGRPWERHAATAKTFTLRVRVPSEG